ncbi:MAG TPA: hypothetical protein PLL36_00245 [Candidatus Hydrogenedentes bacterium]|jgi:hypothetical protein|nr:MAG: hypothetical protein BWX80_01439 [Candidatus Hydrogenedentes bacterium ADurb.Bin101]HOC69396.1 hypothetical protein [Candidatus Hydrogenedentota bacterium]HQM99470.1 hypothetical protein [Candidatus Hydrogenedentota bacterium]
MTGKTRSGRFGKFLKQLRGEAETGPSRPERRTLLAGLLAAPFALAQDMEKPPASLTPMEGAVDGMSGATVQHWLSRPLEPVNGVLPKGKIGTLEISRLIFGSNLIGGYAHSRDLIYVSDLFKAYNTESKVFETLYLAEKAGINTMITPSHELPLIQKYRRTTGGAMQTMVQVYEKNGSFVPDIDEAIKNGADTLYLQGGVTDRLVQAGKIDILHEAIRHIQERGYPAGVGGHSIKTPRICEERDIGADYYVKTCHHDRYWSAHPRENRVEFSIVGPNLPDHNSYHDNIFDLFPEETVAYMETVKKPWVGFKVLAGGAIPPRDGFQYAFSNGADFICVGILDFQINEDVNIALDTLAAIKERKRPWYG